MNKKTKVVIGSRGSDLALWQANFVKKELERKNRNIVVDIKIIKTMGDKILNVSLSKIGDKSLFTKELEIQLLEKKIDLAVHSLKDLQTQIPDGLKLSAVTKRHGAEDVLIARKKGVTILNLKEGATVATGSLRRECQLLHLRPDITTVELRGNVPTRIKKFLKSNWDAIILARAGVAERSLLKTLEGGCQVPIGAFAELKPNGLYLDAMVGSLDGTITFRKRMRGSKKKPELLGKSVAKKLLKAGAKSVLKEIYNSSRRS